MSKSRDHAKRVSKLWEQKPAGSSIATSLLLAANSLMAMLLVITPVFAHKLGPHWDRYYNDNNAQPTIRVKVNATNSTPANDARLEWSGDTILNLPSVTGSEDVYLFDNNDGAKSYCGAAAPFVYSGTHNLSYARAMYNTHCAGQYAYKRSIFCQELGHALGLAHSNDGCMGATYAWDGVVSTKYAVWQHNIDDIKIMYLNRHCHPATPCPSVPIDESTPIDPADPPE